MPAPTTEAPSARTSSRSARSDVTALIGPTSARPDQLGDPLVDAVVGGVTAPAGGVAHDDAVVDALGQVVLGDVEHELHAFARPIGEAHQPDEQPPDRGRAVPATTARRWPRRRCSHPR